MSDNTTSRDTLPENVRQVKITEQLETSFINYAMSVIVDRALPDVRDGLKPVHRRSLYSMYKLKNFYNTKHLKSARVVGDVIGKYHPHGDSSVYDTIVRMAQPFSLRYPLVDGHGNFGDIDGYKAAAMRYTEVRMSKICGEMVADLEKETVDTVPNYDNSETIPVVMPNKIPNLLINGTSGIAVGMATNIPTHNLGEVIDATIALMKNPDLSVRELMNYVPAPDFPSGGIIYGVEDIRRAYETGNGKVIIRAKTTIESFDNDNKQRIVVTELPYGVGPQEIEKKIAECIRDRTIEGITKVVNASNSKIRLEIYVRQNDAPEIICNKLFQQTRMQLSFPINMLALVDNRPEVLNLKQIIEYFIKHRKEVVTRRTVYDLKVARERAHRLEALLIALSNIDEMIAIIRSSANRQEAHQALMNRAWEYGSLNSLIKMDDSGREICKPEYIGGEYGIHNGKYYLSDPQTVAILDMPLHRLTNLENDKIVAEYTELTDQILWFIKILSSDEILCGIIVEELEYIRNTYGDERRSIIEKSTSEITKKDLVDPVSAVVTLSHAGYIKYQPLSEYEAQKRGGRGRRATQVKDEDFIDSVYVVNTHDTVLCFTSLGRVFSLNVYDLPEASSNSKGRPIVNLLRLGENEKVQTIVPINSFDENKFLFFATSNGYVKKTKLSAFRRVNAAGLKAIKLEEGVSLVNVAVTSGSDVIGLFSSDGFACFFNEYSPLTPEADASADDTEAVAETDEAGDDAVADNAEGDDENEGSIVLGPNYRGGVRASGRDSRGVRGIKLNKGQKVVSMLVMDNDLPSVLIATEKGFGKRSPAVDFPLRNRGGKGVIAIKGEERNGQVIGAILVADGDEIIMINDAGILVRTRVNEISVISRYAQGVRLIRLDEGIKLVSLQRIIKDESEEQDESGDTTAVADAEAVSDTVTEEVTAEGTAATSSEEPVTENSDKE